MQQEQLQQLQHDAQDFAVLPQSLLECGVCLSLVCEPVSLSCGHSFCRTCLVKTLQRCPKRCPCCRAVCHTRAEDHPQNVMIAQLVEAAYPELLKRRMRETQAEKASFQLCLPAFFYNVPMFPGETLSLHFFEPRYKIMMQRIISTTQRFAYVPNYTNYTATKGDVALVAQVQEAEFLSDGRVMVKTKLVGRHVVKDHFIEEGTQGLHYCHLEAFQDAPLQGSDLAELEELHTRARERYHVFLSPFKGQLVKSHGHMPSSAVDLSMWMSSFLPFYMPKKHALLESKDTRARLRSCLRCMNSMEAVARQSKKEPVEEAPRANAPQAPPQAEAVPQAVGAQVGGARTGSIAETGVSVGAGVQGR